MKNQKHTLIISVLIVLALLAGGAYAIYNNKKSQPVVNEEVVNTPAESDNTVTEEPKEEAVAPKPTDPWQVFQQYLGYLKAHNADGVNSVLSEKAIQYGKTCPMRSAGSSTADCNKSMDLAYASGSKLSKAYFVNKLSDDKQIILSTEVSLQDGEKTGERNYEKFYLFFTKDKSGNPKFLASYRVITHITYVSDTDLVQKVKEALNSFNDTDQDGLLDQYEGCKSSGASPYNNLCSNTSKTIKDSLGDGWWDGVRVYFGTK